MKTKTSGNDGENSQIIPLSTKYNQRDISMQDIEDFVSAFNEEDVQTRISQSVDACMVSENFHFEKAKDREDLLYIMRNISKVVRAMYLLFDKKAA